ncbi:EamA family transporter [Actinosynnema sp. NPDC047251]|uniref:EamA family transporter n=1 Tax=Saccharothrix espanaensis TaxID=103731 RepID=UPI000313A961|nr:EamA family transporter [Saccharothrix espanaensis]
MKPGHAALAVLTTTIWGVNFVVIKVGLDEFPPLLFSSLRFLAAAVPALWLVGKPRVAWKWIAAVAATLGVAKFGLLFLGMSEGMPAGLSSLVLQSQVIFTIAFATVLLKERPRPVQLVGIAIAATGIVLIALDYGLTSPISALLLVVLGAIAWGLSNVATRYAKPPDALSFIVWVSAFATLPLLLLSVIFEGPSAIITALGNASWAGVTSLLFVAWVSTLFGFGVWGFLLREHNASTVVPFALLVPVAGMFSGWLFLDENLSPVRLGAAALVIAGMAATTIPRPARVLTPVP